MCHRRCTEEGGEFIGLEKENKIETNMSHMKDDTCSLIPTQKQLTSLGELGEESQFYSWTLFASCCPLLVLVKTFPVRVFNNMHTHTCGQTRRNEPKRRL